MPDSLQTLEAERSRILGQFTTLGDLRPGSICAVARRCGRTGPSPGIHRPFCNSQEMNIVNPSSMFGTHVRPKMFAEPRLFPPSPNRSGEPDPIASA